MQIFDKATMQSIGVYYRLHRELFAICKHKYHHISHSLSLS